MPRTNTIVYVDKPLAVAIAAKLIDVLQTRSEGANKSASFNWLIGAETGSEDSSARASDIRELLPEDLVHLIYPYISERHTSIEPIIGRLSAGTTDSFLPGTVLSVQGKLIFPNLEPLPSKYSPFEQIDINLPTTMFHGEPCIIGQLISNPSEYIIPVYFNETAKYQVVFCNDQPVEVTGIVRWTPHYSPRGSWALNMALRCAALWLR